jgi:L-ascorbate 6-phosphate lactonase
MPGLTGPQLIADISAHTPPPGGLTFWWLGQLSVVVKLAGKVLWIDPYLADNPRRQVPPLCAPEDVTNADFVLCTHDHSDHIDPTAIPHIAAASPQATFIAPRPHRERMASLGVPAERFQALDDGEVLESEGLRITGVKAQHEFFDAVPGVGHPFMGYVVEGDGCAAYHSGDTLCYEGLLTVLQAWSFAVMFLPINGRDAVRYRRGTIGNMTYQEAVDLAGQLGPRLVAPMHYDMFATNSADPAEFVDYLDAKFPGQAAWVGEHGMAVDVTGL